MVRHRDPFVLRRRLPSGVMRVLILGSCVTRDAFELLPEGHPVELAEYFARSALGSATHPVRFEGVDTDRIGPLFQRRMVKWDLTGSFLPALESLEWDVLVYDAIDERFATVQNATGAWATVSMEFGKTGYDYSGHRLVRSGTDDAFTLWREGWATLTGRLRDMGRLDGLRINRTWWAGQVDGGGELPSAFSPAGVEHANQYLARLYDHAAHTLGPDQFYEYPPEDIRAAAEHKWGRSPFHYVSSYYDTLIGNMAADADRLSSRS